MENKTHTGFLAPEKIETLEEGAQHTLGSAGLPGAVVNPTGDWLPYAFDREAQSQDGVESSACTVHNSLNQIENAIFKATGIKTEYSKRYVANVAFQRGILNPRSGANVHDILELIRTTTGLLAEGRLPWNDDYYSVDQSLIAQLLLEGPAWYKDWELKHGWLWTGNPTPEQKRAIIQDALTKGVVGCSVYAWLEGPIDGVYIKPQGSQDGHWTGIVQAQGNDPYVCQDSYDPYIKKLDPLFNFSFGKIIYITPRAQAVNHLFLKNLEYKQSHSEVYELQKALRYLGYTIPSGPSYYFGDETKKALWQFQAKNGISDGGIHFGPQTRYAMNRSLAPQGSALGSWLLFIRSLLGI